MITLVRDITMLDEDSMIESEVPLFKEVRFKSRRFLKPTKDAIDNRTIETCLNRITPAYFKVFDNPLKEEAYD